jgi:hypothetical protein
LLNLLRTAAYADAVKPYTNGEFDQAAEYMLTFASTRSQFVRGEVSRLAGTTTPLAVRAAARK